MAHDQQYMLQDIYTLLDDGDRRTLKPFGLSTSQYAVLLLLDGAQGRRLTEMSEQLLREKSTMTRIVDRLEQVGLVRRIADPSDRRAQRVVLTLSGTELLRRARAAHQDSLERRWSVLTKDEQQQLVGLLGKLRSGLRADPEA